MKPWTMLGIGTILTVAWAGSASAQRAPSERDARKALGLPATGAVSPDAIRAKARALKEAEGHIFFDAQGKADKRHFDRKNAKEAQAEAAPAPARDKKQPRKAADILPKLGRVVGGKIRKADFKAGRRLYRKLDPTGRGYVTVEDLKAVHDLGRRAGARVKAGKFLARFDKNRDGRVTRTELPPASADRVFAAMDANKDGAVTLDEATKWIAARADARRKKKIHR